MEQQHPKALRVLILLTALNYLNLIDRYILAAVLSSIKIDLQLSDFQAGLLATAFIIPYMVTAPLFGWLGDTKDRSKILALGAGLWSLATCLTGFSKTFGLMFSARFLLGIGESAFSTTSAAFLSNFFTPEKRGRMLAILGSGVPVGAALGYVLGGILSSKVGWQNAFYIVGFPGLVLAFFVWFLGDTRHSSQIEQFKLKEVLKTLFSNKAYVFAVAGSCAYSFVVGGIAHWMPTYLQRSFELTQLKANTIFGGIAVGAGLAGTLLGGWIGDYLQKKSGGGQLKVCAFAMGSALPFLWLSLQTSDLKQFIIFLVIAQILFFLSTSPINVAILQLTPKKNQTSAIALYIFFSYLLGGAISPPLIGRYSDMTGSLQSGLMISTPVLFVSFLLWFLGSRAASKQQQNLDG